MGWISISKEGEILREEEHGRPVQAGEEGKLAVIAQEDFGHKIAIDLNNAIVAIDYETIGVQNGTVELSGSPTFLFICDDTNIGGDLFGVVKTEPDENGWYNNIITPIIWRPIWFTRYTMGIPTKVVGAQATLPPEYGGKNVKVQIMLFEDGRIGIYNN
jgi:hypothetical protein